MKMRTAHIALALALAFAGAPAWALDLAKIRGDATLSHAGAASGAKQGDRIEQGDEISTTSASEVLIDFDEDGKLAMRQDTALRFEEMVYDAQARKQRVSVRVVRGSLRFVSGVAGKHKVIFKSGNVAVGLRGTDLEVVQARPGLGVESGTYVRVNEGEVEMVARDGTTLVLGRDEIGHGGEATRSFVPRPPLVKVHNPPAALFERGSLDELLR